MTTPFDPYHRWLGIRPEEQPADHYRLLGLARFEDDVEVIRDAAERQIAHVRRYAAGDHAEDAKRILNELGGAKACLIVQDEKLAYDATLQAGVVVERDVRHAAETPEIDLLTSSAAAPILLEIVEPSLGVMASTPDVDDPLQRTSQPTTPAYSTAPTPTRRRPKTLAQMQSLRQPQRPQAFSWRLGVGQVDDVLKRIAGDDNALLHGFLRVFAIAVAIIFPVVCLLAVGSWAIHWSSDAAETAASPRVTIASPSPTPPTPAPTPPPTLTPTPPPPLVLAPIADAEVDEGQELRLEFALVDAGGLSDLVSFEFMGESHGAVLDSRGVFTWTPTESQGPGDFQFQVRAVAVSNVAGSERASEPLTVRVAVLERNQPPQFEPIGEQHVMVGGELTLTLKATDPDLPANVLTFIPLNKASIGDLNSVTGEFRWTPNDSSVTGEYIDLVVEVRDNGSPPQAAQQTIRMRVDAKPLAVASSSDTSPKTLKGHTGSITCVTFSPDGHWLLSSSEDKTIRLWDVETGREVRRFDGHRDPVWCVRFFPTGDKSVSCGGRNYSNGSDNSIRFWDVETGRELDRFSESGPTCFRNLTVSPDGKMLLSAGAPDDGVRLWDLRLRRELRQFKGQVAHEDDDPLVGGPGFTVAATAFLNNARRALFGVEDGTIRVWDLQQGRELQRFAGDEGDVTSLALSIDGRIALSGNTDGIVRVWDVATGRQLHRLDGHGRLVVNSVAISPDSKLAATGGRDDSVRLWDVQTGRQLSVSMPHGDRVTSLVFSPTASLLASGSRDTSIKLWPLGSSGTTVIPADAEPLPNDITNLLGMTLKLIPAGEFLMGSPPTEKDRESDEQQHRVRITQPFYMGTTEVTQGQWRAVMKTTPWKGWVFAKEGSDYPATAVSWEDAIEFCQRLSATESRTYRLPTEAEWEYACRAGSMTAYCFGDDAASLTDYAWFDENAGNVNEQYAHRVRQKRANAYGLFDMHGNVWEWCSDRYEADYYGKSRSSAPPGATTGSSRVLRGGSWLFAPQYCRSANRDGDSPSSPGGITGLLPLGFRVSSNVGRTK
jgi:formylglycine-generating enzyme required for sulfatase activity